MAESSETAPRMPFGDKMRPRLVLAVPQAAVGLAGVCVIACWAAAWFGQWPAVLALSAACLLASRGGAAYMAKFEDAIWEAREALGISSRAEIEARNAADLKKAEKKWEGGRKPMFQTAEEFAFVLLLLAALFPAIAAIFKIAQGFLPAGLL